ncbi:MAG: hypothetical protein O3C10_10320 [Chloroflexi bacterium]|nr:hypothetical protein [Chloroflexota bacterium]
MVTSLALLYLTLFAGIGVLAVLLVRGAEPEDGIEFFGLTPVEPDLRYVLVIEENDFQHMHTPAVPRGCHA